MDLEQDGKQPPKGPPRSQDDSGKGDGSEDCGATEGGEGDGVEVPTEEDQYLCLSQVAHKMNTTLLRVCSLEEETFYLASEEDLETIVSILQMETVHADHYVGTAVQQVYSVDGFNENRHRRMYFSSKAELMEYLGNVNKAIFFVSSSTIETVFHQDCCVTTRNGPSWNDRVGIPEDAPLYQEGYMTPQIDLGLMVQGTREIAKKMQERMGMWMLVVAFV